eukprot:TRINITY_DN1046_c0_g2_i2.p1 TRINITY_DN1046_c0_g2~~TRINITY_DN1046_c0_g2_i2.p1  ORF type:complete len:182 (-),score=44.02 TRINITY_DN1046_c0_g2_i2:61-606(-)
MFARPTSRLLALAGRGVYARGVASVSSPSSPALTDLNGKQHHVSDLFANKKVVLFGIPGNSPVDNHYHIPSFVKHSDKILGKGVSFIGCVSSMSRSVLGACQNAYDPNNYIHMLSDETGDFIKQHSLAEVFAMDETGVDSPIILSKRWVMVVDNGKVTHKSVEDHPEDFTSTDAFSVMKHL